MHRTRKRHFVWDVVVGIVVHIEEAFNKLVLETLIASQKGVDNSVSAALETSILHTVQKVVKSPDFMSRFSDAVIDSRGFITPVMELVKSEQWKAVTEEARFEDQHRQVEEP